MDQCNTIRSRYWRRICAKRNQSCYLVMRNSKEIVFLRTANTVGIANQYGLFRSSDKRFRSFLMYTATDGRTLTHTPGRDKLCCMISVVVTLILRMSTIESWPWRQRLPYSPVNEDMKRGTYGVFTRSGIQRWVTWEGQVEFRMRMMREVCIYLHLFKPKINIHVPTSV